MNVYFAGIGGVGIGPLAQIAYDAGYTVYGSDLAESPLTQQLTDRGIQIELGQDGSFLRRTHHDTPLDWYVYTAALPPTHPELLAAKELGIRTGKRDEFLAELIAAKDLQLLAVAGTHGKTTTTGMLVWALKQLGVPVSYSVGSTLSFGASGVYEPGSRYFVYECDEYDRNLLHFRPSVSLITSLDYDHPDTYPTHHEYRQTFRDYIAQSGHTIMWENDQQYLWPQPESQLPQPQSQSDLANATLQVLNPAADIAPLALAGEHNRRNGTLVLRALEYIGVGTPDPRTQALNQFPGTDRRFEKLANNLYSDYGHHPQEIAATLQLARELSDHVVLVYQPHQNLRQHSLYKQYTTQFDAAEKIYWLPTYLSREDPALPILEPQQLTVNITNQSALTYAQLDDALWDKLTAHRQQGHLVLCMGAGTIDRWVRQTLALRG